MLRCGLFAGMDGGQAEALLACLGGQRMDYPADPQHPHEDIIDALRGGLMAALPQGRKPQPKIARVRAGKVF